MRGWMNDHWAGGSSGTCSLTRMPSPPLVGSGSLFWRSAVTVRFADASLGTRVEPLVGAKLKSKLERVR